MSDKGSFKDLFSKQSSDYARFRPTYPPKLFDYLASLVDPRDLAWDVGTGNGQAAVALAEHFERVVATDPSEKQIAGAVNANPKIEYRLGAAEKGSFEDHSVAIITAAQCLHWFRREEFFAEAQRVLRPGGILAFWCYALCNITPEVDAVVMELYRDVLGAYWEPERKLVEEGYRSVRMPFQEIAPPAFQMSAQWGLDHLIGYLGTWSALQSYLKKNGSNPLEAMYPKLRAAWGQVQSRQVTWELAVRVGRNSL